MSLSKRSKILIAILVIGLVGGFVAYKIIYKPHPVIENQKAAFVGVADAFKKDVVAQQAKWLNGIVELEGDVTEVDDKGLLLSESIYCQFKNPESLQGIKKGKSIRIKGRFIGYDDLLEEVKLDQCIVQ